MSTTPSLHVLEDCAHLAYSHPAGGECHLIANGERSEAVLARAVECYNALAGIQDPEKAVQAAREALAFYASCWDNGAWDLAGVETAEKALSLLTPKEETKPTVITTDPAKMAAIYAKPATQSNAEAVSSILKQNAP